jgi:hypothetical protein
MHATYTSKNYAPDKVRSRYVCKPLGFLGYHFCEVGENRRYDLRQGVVRPDEIPVEVREAADKRAGFFPPWVEWPL